MFEHSGRDGGDERFSNLVSVLIKHIYSFKFAHLKMCSHLIMDLDGERNRRLRHRREPRPQKNLHKGGNVRYHLYRVFPPLCRIFRGIGIRLCRRQSLLSSPISIIKREHIFKCANLKLYVCDVCHRQTRRRSSWRYLSRELRPLSISTRDVCRKANSN